MINEKFLDKYIKPSCKTFISSAIACAKKNSENTEEAFDILMNFLTNLEINFKLWIASEVIKSNGLTDIIRNATELQEETSKKFFINLTAFENSFKGKEDDIKLESAKNYH